MGVCSMGMHGMDAPGVGLEKNYFFATVKRNILDIPPKKTTIFFMLRGKSIDCTTFDLCLYLYDAPFK
jgi:hypothetical protein